MASCGPARLKERVSLLLDRTAEPENPLEYRKIKCAFLEIIHKLILGGVRAYLVGGALRELCCTESWVLPRDYDIVVIGENRQKLEEIVGEYGKDTTSLGGMRFSKQVAIGGQTLASRYLRIDMWTVSDTWAIRQLGLSNTINNVVSHAFLNVDAVAISIDHDSVTRTREVVETGFFKGLRRRTVEILYEPNPYPQLCAVRAVDLATRLRFRVGPLLADFIRRCYMSSTSSDFREAQVRHFGQVRLEPKKLEALFEYIADRSHVCGSKGFFLPDTSQLRFDFERDS